MTNENNIRSYLPRTNTQAQPSTTDAHGHDDDDDDVAGRLVGIAAGINAGVHALRAGDADEANEIFAETLRLVRTSLTSFCRIMTKTRGEDGRQPALLSPSTAIDTGICCEAVPISSPEGADDDGDICLLYNYARTVSIPAQLLRKLSSSVDSSSQEQGEDDDEEDKNVRLIESAFHYLAGVLIFNLALLHHTKGLALDRPTGARHIERAKALYASAQKLLAGCNVADQQRDATRMLGIWNNLALIFKYVGDVENARACGQQMLSFIATYSRANNHPNHRPRGGGTAGVSSSSVLIEDEDDLWMHFFDHASQLLGNHYVRAAAAA